MNYGEIFFTRFEFVPLLFIILQCANQMNQGKSIFAQHLIKKARKLYDKEYYRLDIDEMVYAFDSSTIELCLKLCPWADFHHGKGAVKMHTLLSLRGSIPTFVHLTEGKVHDSKAMDSLPIDHGAHQRPGHQT